jgi:hypothetical protein
MENAQTLTGPRSRNKKQTAPPPAPTKAAPLVAPAPLKISEAHILAEMENVTSTELPVPKPSCHNRHNTRVDCLKQATVNVRYENTDHHFCQDCAQKAPRQLVIEHKQRIQCANLLKAGIANK